MIHIYKYTWLLFMLFIASCNSTDSGSSNQADNLSDTKPQQCNTSADTANYRLTFHSNWTSVNFPTNYPSGAHFSALIGASHNDSIKLWQQKVIASKGIESMAETGSTSALKTEISSFATASIGSVLSSSSTTIDFTTTKATPLISLVTMIAPSSDWFTGVDSLNLLTDKNQWQSSNISLLAYDAGTEDDDTVFSFNNSATNPQSTISLLTQAQTDFSQGKHRSENRFIGRFEFTLQCEGT